MRHFFWQAVKGEYEPDACPPGWRGEWPIKFVFSEEDLTMCEAFWAPRATPTRSETGTESAASPQSR